MYIFGNSVKIYLFIMRKNILMGGSAEISKYFKMRSQSTADVYLIKWNYWNNLIIIAQYKFMFVLIYHLVDFDS